MKLVGVLGACVGLHSIYSSLVTTLVRLVPKCFQWLYIYIYLAPWTVLVTWNVYHKRNHFLIHCSSARIESQPEYSEAGNVYIRVNNYLLVQILESYIER